MSRYLIPFENPSISNLWDLWSDPLGPNFNAPARLFQQNFGVGLNDEDLFPSSRGWYLSPRRCGATPRETGLSQVLNDDKEFKVELDVTQFKPNEVSVRAIGNRVIVEGKHEEREDEHGLIQRHFKRTYMLPRNVDSSSLKSSLSTSGVLTIEAPKKAVESPVEKQIAVEVAGSEDTSGGGDDAKRFSVLLIS